MLEIDRHIPSLPRPSVEDSLPVLHLERGRTYDAFKFLPRMNPQIPEECAQEIPLESRIEDALEGVTVDADAAIAINNICNCKLAKFVDEFITVKRSEKIRDLLNIEKDIKKMVEDPKFRRFMDRNPLRKNVY